MEHKFKPILYQTEMIKSILANIKKMTRRTQGLEIPNQNPDGYKFLGWDKNTVLFESPEGKLRECKPKFNLGDILWVRETFEYFAANWNPHDKIGKTSQVTFNYKATDRQFLNEVETMGELAYVALNYIEKNAGFKPSIHMPKEAARIFLKVTDVRCERLCSISEEDAIDEGIQIVGRLEDSKKTPLFKDYLLKSEKGTRSPVSSFFSLWRKINGSDSYHKNSWVWVYTFEKIEKPENFK